MLKIKKLLAVLFIVSIGKIVAQGSWTTLSFVSPGQNGGVAILLSDGSVMVKTESGG